MCCFTPKVLSNSTKPRTKFFPAATDETLGEIICELAEEYEADSNALAADVRDTLSDLQQRKLIEFK